MTSGRPHIAWTDAQLKRMRAIVESGDLTLADIGRRFRCSEHEVRRQTVAGGWVNPNVEKVKPKPKEQAVISRSTAVYDIHNRPPGGMPIDAARQAIASAAFARGVVVASSTFREIPAATLTRAIKGACEKTRDNEERRTRVETIIRSIASKLGNPGPVQVYPSALGVLESFAGITKPARRKARAA